jgi:hypothetical protein
MMNVSRRFYKFVMAGLGLGELYRSASRTRRAIHPKAITQSGYLLAGILFHRQELPSLKTRLSVLTRISELACAG